MRIRSWQLVSFFLLIVPGACNTLKNPFSSNRSPHEKYGDAIDEAGLKKTQLGILWFDAAEKALAQPQPVSFPYKETGYFPAEKPSAAGYIFDATRGENIVVSLGLRPADSTLFFAELWQPSSGKPSFLTAMDTLNKTLKYTVKKDGKFIVRIQPQLLRSIEYTIVINRSPSLAFPVDSSGNPKIISLWGAGRDKGSRKHEGVDISANFRTPALASADGVTRVTENNLGGKVVFLRDDKMGYSLYYAHLDSQIAHTGDRVKAGDTIGLVGKTGNAQHTIPHLHFGIYTMGGAIDPIVFIDPKIKQPQPVKASLE
ncbi:MAG: M23 family metallopeptidase, partial [Ginsengibacter sp.]